MASGESVAKCNFEEINRARNDPYILVIDVREMTELLEVGQIPGSINIPRKDFIIFVRYFYCICTNTVGEIKYALSPEISKEAFKLKYNSEKPEKEDQIIFTCRSGRRSNIAQQEAFILGYTK